MHRGSSIARKPGAGVKPPSLPSNITEIRKVLDGEVPLGSMINIIGMIKDARLPIATKGTDFKCTLTLFDLSTQDPSENDAININIFRPEADMPHVRARDIIVIFSTKVQNFGGNISLISNKASAINVFNAEKIPRFPRSAEPAMVPDPKNQKTKPDRDHFLYVSHLYHNIDTYDVPDVEEFKEKASASLNVKDKFGLLKDVKEGKFYNLIVQVARQPWDLHDKLTMYVSDYTDNEAFFNYTWEGLKSLPGAGGDPYGYTSTDAGNSVGEWHGPYGKRAMQITCWEPHAEFIRNEVSAGQWVYLRNVQIKYGRDGQNLEGYMREEWDKPGVRAAGTKVNVDVMDHTDRDMMDPRLKDAIRRWRDYEKQKKKQIKQVEGGGAKRKGADAPLEEQPQQKLNSKERRKQKRVAIEKKEEEKRWNEDTQLALNELVACESHAQELSTVESMLEPALLKVKINDEVEEIPVPFHDVKYRARVRVVDFYPPQLEDFAQSRGQTAFDVLSDVDSASSDDSLDSDEDEEDAARRGYKRIWEWRFALKLQDAIPTKKGNNNNKNGANQNTLWVTIDNTEAQCLTGLDATDLRHDPDNLAQLRERLFTLWGNLEEHKASIKPPKSRVRDKHPPIERPPLESSDVEDNSSSDEIGDVAGTPISNKPFDCCIKQYGIRVKKWGDDGDGELPTAAVVDDDRDPYQDWMRVYALFGTRISM